MTKTIVASDCSDQSRGVREQLKELWMSVCSWLATDIISIVFVAVSGATGTLSSAGDPLKITSVVAGMVVSVFYGLVQITRRVTKSKEDAEAKDLRKRLSEVEDANRRLSQERAGLADELDNLKNLVQQSSKSMLYGELKDLIRGPLQFPTDDEIHERISLYLHNTVSEFQLISRCSHNPLLEGTGRQSYAHDKGCIGNCWRNKACFEILPTDQKEWVKHCKRSGLTEEDIKQIKMRAIAIGAIRIDDHRGKPRAVVLIESDHPTRYTLDSIKELMEGAFTEEVKRNLLEFVEQLAPWIGDLGESDRGQF